MLRSRKKGSLRPGGRVPCVLCVYYIYAIHSSIKTKGLYTSATNDVANATSGIAKATNGVAQ